jgi:hypothetical protein
MSLLRRLLARSILAPFLMLPLMSCGNPKPSPKAVAEAVGHTPSFFEPKMVTIPRRIDARTPAEFGGGALDDRQLATIDPVVSILHANKLVEIQDIYGPDPGTGGYSHIISITPASGSTPDLFVETDEPGTDPTWQQVRKTPGWHVTLGRRELTKVWQINDSSSPNEKISPGYVLARFDFHWIPTDIGKLFDQGDLSFDDLPGDLQRASVNAARLDSRASYVGQAYLTRDKNGDWRVTMFECRRCPGES